MGYEYTRNDGSWSYAIRFSKRFTIVHIRPMIKSGLTELQEGFPLELHLHIDLKVREDMPGQSEKTEDIYIAIHRSPAVCTIMHTYFQNNRSGGSSVLAIAIAAAGEPSTPQCRPDPWQFPFDVDLCARLLPAKLEHAHVIGTYTTFSNDQSEPPAGFRDAALEGSERWDLEKDMREVILRCGEKVFTKRAAVRFK